jgi:hypothetical protein
MGLVSMVKTEFLHSCERNDEPATSLLQSTELAKDYFTSKLYAAACGMKVREGGNRNATKG